MILYHYTSLETLLAILNGYDSKSESFTLRVTHALYLNDSQEGQLLLNVFSQIGIPFRIIQTCQNLDGYPFVFSLSEAKDDLNMWRGYANNACGVAIGFEYDKLNCSINQFVKPTDECALLKCEYTTEEELYNKMQHEPIVKDTLSQVKSNKDYINTTDFHHFLCKYMMYKSDAFNSEKEWRMILKSHFDEKFRIGINTIIPFKEIPISKTAISQIVLGAKCDFDKTSFSICRMLKNIGIQNVNVIKSNIPYQ